MTTSTTSPVLAGPPSSCCFKGFQHEGTPVGKVITIADVETYVSDPPADTTGPKKVVIFFSDVFGPLCNNAKLIQDYFASHGFYVLGLDYFFGDNVDAYVNKPDWQEKRLAWFDFSIKRAAEPTKKWLKVVREIHGDAKYFAVGYCFGAPHVLDFAANKLIPSIAAIAHPSFLNESHFENLKKPLLLSCAEIDSLFTPQARHRAEEILAKNNSSYHLQLFSGVEHSFASRGDESVEHIRWAKEESARSIVAWFKRFSEVSSPSDVQ
ncbi:hypothetical protein GALMADRAFT_903078 [Galerina marginata CBS 339.88]|uniref:Dienelactone hydrolase domain-containing protein n=1 Tax=Galerina marginata (strain CBS 339.88) TaxID=685588 RepID=A0A067SGM7_GALM3|nr:hypothetical protein GALMADRAFT_903078 [Galerina marginata CBS 339.88]